MTDRPRSSQPEPLDIHQLNIRLEELSANISSSRARFAKETVKRYTARERPNRFPEFTMAFQPIVDTESREVFAFEALARSPNGESTASVLGRIMPRDLHMFDALCRKRAIQMAHSLSMQTRLSLNITPDAACDLRHGIHTTIQSAREFNFSERRLILEITEQKAIADLRAVRRSLAAVRNRGVMIALDDFGAGYNGLNTLVNLKPDLVKIDIGLIDGIDTCDARQAVVSSLSESCSRLKILLVAEGVETHGQARMLRSLGVALMQGYLFAKPAIESLPLLSPDALLLA
ncbi:MAG: EAL domain-containing protein [Shinella sp.]|nr:EAL domain-containing protein [Shinella sp.]